MINKHTLHADFCKWHEDRRDLDCTCRGKTNHPANCDWHFEQYPFECNCGYYPRPSRKGNWMQTYLGNQCWPIDPRPEEIHLFDIAHALSMQCRYNGMCERFYSVAEHSVHVSRVVPREMALLGLLHDASEAYVCDIPRPLKPFLTGYAEIEERMWCAIADRFGLDRDMPAEIKEADNAVLLAEAEVIMKPHPAPWAITGEPADVEIRCWSPTMAESKFKQRFLEIIVDTDAEGDAARLIDLYRESVA